MDEQKPTEKRGSTDKLWDVTRKTFQTASFRANQYKRIVQKKIDLASLHKKIALAHGDLGRTIDDLREKNEPLPLEQEEVQHLFRKLDGLKDAAAALEEELETIKNEISPDEKGAEEESSTTEDRS